MFGGGFEYEFLSYLVGCGLEVIVGVLEVEYWVEDVNGDYWFVVCCIWGVGCDEWVYWFGFVDVFV